MKLVKLESFANVHVGFVRATFDCGIEGWGQVSTCNSDITARVLHRQVAPWMLGQDKGEGGKPSETAKNAGHADQPGHPP